jgi:hypothetical protein
MRRAYIFIYDSELGERETVKNFIDSVPEIMNWRRDLPSSMYLISEKDAEWICDKIRSHFPKGSFLVAELTENKQGYLSEKTWKLLRDRHTPDEVP